MCKALKENEIMDRMKYIIENRLGICISKICADYRTENLLGEKIRMEARYLLYLFFEAEKEFGIHISQESILAYEFASLNGIVQVIKKHIELKTAM
jgi:peptide maturation system acyl carrier-related protein